MKLIRTLFSCCFKQGGPTGVKKFTPRKLAHRRISQAALATLLMLVACNAFADIDPRAEYDKKIKSAQVVTVLGPNLAGDSTNLYTGSTSFSATDVSLPGAVGPTLAVGRTFAVEFQRQAAQNGTTTITRQRLFGDWDLDIPHLSGVYSNQQGWDIDSDTPKKRCSVLSQLKGGGTAPALGTPRVYPIAFPQWWATEFWSGIDLHLPGGGSQTLLVATETSVQKPTTGGPYHWTSKDDWWFSCLEYTTNGGTTGGEGFVALSPSGDKYTLGFMTSRRVTRLWEQICTLDGVENPQPPFDGQCDHRTLTRKEFMLLPTRIEDRFGNWVDYTWSTDSFARLSRMVAKDGRTITLTYNASGYVSSVSDGTHTWTYEYAGNSLTAVNLPDGSRWQYSFAALDYLDPMPYSCQDIGEAFNCYSPPMHYIWSTGYAIHPSGARVDFTVANHFKPTVNGMGAGGGSYPLALESKTLSGPGIATATWTFSYAPTRDAFKAACAAGPCPAQVTTDSVAPDGSITRAAFGIVPSLNQGMLLSEQSGKVVSGTPVFSKTSLLGYISPTGSNGFIVRRGTNPMLQDAGLGDEAELFYSERKLPVNLKQTTLQAVQFAWQATRFDAYARPSLTTKASTGNDGGDSILVETMSYKNDTAKWVIGLPERTWCWNAQECNGTAGREMSFTNYNAATLLPWRNYSFGISGPTFAYNADGSLATVTDGRGNTTSLGSWYRGVPRLITWPAIGLAPSKTMTAVVSPVGEIWQVTDELSNQINYSYDAMSRLSGITYPTTGQAWSPLARGLAPVAAIEYGIPAGHWRETVQTGNGKVTTFYNALWQPVVVLTEDVANTNTRSFVVNRYDSMGRKTFTSYPVLTLTSVNDTLKGVLTSYDELGRVTGTQQDSEVVSGQSVLTTTTQYLSGFRTQVTNPRGLSTTTSYKVFDSPGTDMPAKILKPEGVTTTISRQSALGKPVSIKREGLYSSSNLSATRSYVYDTGERLCKTINPESGAALVDYDLAGNVAWSVDGSALTSLACDRASVSAGEKTGRTYDAMNRLLTVVTPGNVANITNTYFADGAINTIAAANPGGNTVVNSYSYNNRGLLTRETIQVNALTPWTFDYAYNGNGHRSSQTYPGSVLVGYAPDALGRPTQVGTFASGVTYYPTGAISGFTYGNGIVHTMTPNARQLPARSVDAFGATKFLDDTYAYDANGNVLSMADAAGTGVNDRTWGVAAPTLYDGLDRLLSVRGTNWGALTGSYNALYTYDPLDNLRSAKLGAAGYTHAYDGNNRLVSMQLNGGSTYALATDAAGNITSDARSSHGYQFDIAHRLNAATGPGAESYLYDGNGRRARTLNLATGTIEYFGYGQDGRLLQDWSNRRNVRNAYVYLGNTLVGLYEVKLSTGVTASKYKHTDALGSPVVTTDLNKFVLNRTAYTPYGTPMTPVDGVGYTGHFIDVGTGLTYMQQRYYDPQIGRFLSVDPVPTDPATGANFSSYWYANNNPYRFTDPDGRVATLGTVTVTGSRPPSEYDYYSPETKARRNQEGRDILKWFGGPLAAAGSHMVDGEYWSAGFEAGGVLPLFKIVKGVEVFEVAKDLNSASKATVILPHKQFRGTGLGKLGMEAHHLIEKRFAALFNTKPGDMKAIALLKAGHQEFTNAWRQAIPYGIGTAKATKEQVENAARQIYANHPAILNALGL